ncbi:MULTISPECIES: ATP-grasp domain-containing protein [unclassified Paenibacillus]|uniref:ATP-grasp domain-containing protein n=1 Tax=unclassified Paenibacillus TaxID=185978 RepID=UPI0030FA4264
MSANSSRAIFLLEPCFFGEKYIEFAAELELIVIVIRREGGPKVEKAHLVHFEIISDITDAESTYLKMEYFFSQHPDISRNSGIVPGHDYAVPVAAIISQKFGWNSIRPDVAHNARSKECMRNGLKGSQYVSNPDYHLYHSVSELKEQLDQIQFPAIVKPVDMTSSMLVKCVQTSEQLIRQAEKIIQNEDNFGYPSNLSFLVEEYIRGQEYSFEAFMFKGACKFAHITEKMKTPLPYFVELQHTLPASMESSKYTQLLNSFINLMAELGITEGPCHLEFVLSGGHIYIIEYSTRLAGDRITDLYSLSYGVNLHKASILCALGERPDEYLHETRNDISRIRYFHQKSGKIKQISGVEEARRLPGVIEIVIEKKEGDTVPDEMTSSMDRYGFFVLKADTYDELEKVSHQVEDTIQFVMERETTYEKQKG